MDGYSVAREITDGVFGEGAYAELNKDHPDPAVRAEAYKVSCLMCGERGHPSNMCRIAESIEVLEDGTEMCEYYCTSCAYGV